MSISSVERLTSAIVPRRTVCPLCLSSLALLGWVERSKALCLNCTRCNSRYYVVNKLPVLLVKDENWQMKDEEIQGEVAFNTKITPPEVHAERNAFVDCNSEKFLDNCQINLSGQSLLSIGCSMAELEFFASKGATVTCLDIVPPLAMAALSASETKQLHARWICADGEFLPFEDETFDRVAARQTVHHMLKYHSAISEFFRVCKRGGQVLIVDEPFVGSEPADLERARVTHEALSRGGRTIWSAASSWLRSFDQRFLDNLEQKREYLPAKENDPESMLADKYHSFTLLNCLQTLKLHSDKIRLYWPDRVAWVDESGDVVKFVHGPNPCFDKPLPERLLCQGNVSIAAEKTRRTIYLRSREGVRPLPFEALAALVGEI